MVAVAVAVAVAVVVFWCVERFVHVLLDQPSFFLRSLADFG